MMLLLAFWELWATMSRVLAALKLKISIKLPQKPAKFSCNGFPTNLRLSHLCYGSPSCAMCTHTLVHLPHAPPHTHTLAFVKRRPVSPGTCQWLPSDRTHLHTDTHKMAAAPVEVVYAAVARMIGGRGQRTSGEVPGEWGRGKWGCRKGKVAATDGFCAALLNEFDWDWN